MPTHAGFSHTVSPFATSQSSTSQSSQDIQSTSPSQLHIQPTTSSWSSTHDSTGQESYPPASGFDKLPEDPEDSEQYSYSEPVEDGLTDSGDKQEITEDMNYRETIQSERSFMG